MSQSWTDNCYQIDHNGVTDLTAFENNFNCLKSQFSGLSSPSSPIAGQRWYDKTHKLQRCYIGGSWLVLMPGDTNQKIWTYCNSCPEGMVTVSMVDRVLALKGGSQSYNVNGGTTAGSWSLSHSHSSGSYSVNTYHRHNYGEWVPAGFYSMLDVYTNYQGSTTQPLSGTTDSQLSSTWRPGGSVGIMIKPDI